MNQGLTQVLTQLKTIWGQLGLNQRISIVLTALVVLGGLAGLGFLSSRVEYALLYGKLDDAEAAKVVAALDENSIPYKISRAGGSITVPAEKVHFARMQLATKGIPRSSDGVGFEIFDKPNFGISDFVQRANYLRAVQGELARTIGQVDSIENARVMIVMPENRLLSDAKRKPTASVFIRVRGNAQLPQQSVQAIRFLVANAVEGLQANSVSVVDNLGNVLTESHEEDSVVGLSTSQLSARKNIEQYLSRKAEGMLETVLGPGQAVVRVSAEINYDTVSRTEEKYDPEGQVLRSATVNDEDTQSAANPAGGGVAGAAVNASTTTNATAALTNMNTSKKKITNNQYEINKTTSTLTQVAGGLRRVTAAVFVASQVSGAGTNRVVTARTPEEMQKLRRIVQSALGVTAEEAESITLEEITFNDQAAVETTRLLDVQQQRDFYWNIGKNVGYVLAALLVLFSFWRLLQKTTVESIPLGVPVGELMNGENGHAHGRNGNGSNGDKGRSNVVTVEVLNQLIRDNPDNLTQSIRTWMTRGKAK
ncbi:MAG TPA: flagellar basal-body MS-ring/collar protein FliF [Verrucomicrobiae bacterium]